MRIKLLPIVVVVLVLIGLGFIAVGIANAQQFPPPTGPVTFCFTQAAPPATSWATIVDGVGPTAMTLDSPMDSRCSGASTHSFKLAASLFQIGSHIVVVRSTNTFGSVNGPEFTVVVGLAPGQGTITGVFTSPPLE